ncbi:MAG: LptA/OstA family protein [Candidatus Melainabacteria bacterium]|nr:LptA/OstA family protein [Candidatus Melainabacteria bacterium]
MLPTLMPLLSFFRPHANVDAYLAPACVRGGNVRLRMLGFAITVGLLAFGAGGGGAVLANVPTVLEPGQIDIVADQTSYDTQSGRSFFKGNVVMAYNNIRIKSAEAAVELTPNGQPRIASFYPKPVATHTVPNKGTDRLDADVIHMLLDKNVFKAEGNVVSNVVTVAADPFLIRADVQQFNSATRTVLAKGSVDVRYKDTHIQSPQALMRVTEAGKAERVVFLGGASIDQGASHIQGGRITVIMGSGNLIAEDNVSTRVDLPKQQASKPGSIEVRADYQQFDKVSQTVLASGNVRIVYEDYVATGPKATFKLDGNEVKNIVLSGRPSIADKERKITADRIVITPNPKKFDAVGHVKTQFITQGKSEPAAGTTAAATGSAKKPTKGTAAAGAGKSATGASVKPPAKVLTEEEELPTAELTD